MTELSVDVRTNGIVKNKILVVVAILGAILISMLMFGVLVTDENKKISADESIMAYRENDIKDTDQLLQDISAKKLAASTTVKSSIPLQSSTSLSQLVPPIKTTNTESDKEVSLDSQVVAEYKKKQLMRQYASLSAKSLIFSSASVTANNLPNNPESISRGKANINTQVMPESTATEINYLKSEVIDLKSPYQIMAGSIIPAIMINGLNSDLSGQVIAQVRENVYDSSSGKYLLIPQGAKLVGLYDNNIAYGQERILVAWNRLIYANGRSINLKAMPGSDLEGYTGFYDKVDNKYWKIFGSSFIMGVITGAMQYSQNNTNANVQSGGIGVATNNTPTVGNTLSGSLGQQLGQTGLMVTQKN
ncbi:MAG: Type secretion system protein virB10, partial [Burkholderiales bacterium]|nr:Type secretion system protein virB10 [Burkholderiales bacterium]